MPELPEVETVRRVLESSIQSLTIKDILIRYDAIVVDSNTFKQNVIGKRILELKRYGKYLIFVLNEGFILSHLRMEGKYFYTKDESIDNKHVHVIFTFDNGYKLMYQDVRKFGRMMYLSKDIYDKEPLSLMGPDLILDETIDTHALWKKLSHKNKSIKSTLLDQSFLSGLGNIYVDEVLFEAMINPLRPSNSIQEEELESIIKASKRILLLAISYKGTTIRSYTSSLGVEGEYQNYLKVHQKVCCPNCNRELLRVKIDSRMTYYCDNCQR